MVGRKKCLAKPQMFRKGHNTQPVKVKRGKRRGKRCKVVRKVVGDHDNATPPRYLRLERGLYNQSSAAEKGVPSLFDQDGRKMNVKVLRPLDSKEETTGKCLQLSQELNSNRIFHYGKTQELWNVAIEGHRNYSSRCIGQLEWDLNAETQWGLGWIEQLQCQRCHYKSPRMKLFEEVGTGLKQRGRKSAAPNRALQVGLTHCSIGNHAVRDVLLSLNIPAPAASGMQYQSNTVAPVMQEVNKTDMATRLEKLMIVSPSIMVEGDARYNNPLYSAAGKTPYQPATQAVYTVCENTTSQKQVLSVVCKNKHCRVAESLRRDGNEVICPDHHGTCSANLQLQDPIGDEGSWAREAFRQMFDNCPKVSFNYFTTDGDSRAFTGLQQTQAEYSAVIPEHLRDALHLTKNMKSAIKKATFTPTMFPSSTQTKRDQEQGYLAEELARRCYAEFDACYRKLGGNITKIQEAMIKVPEVIINCYEGDCSDCNKYSFVCGSKKENPWIKGNLPPNFQIYPCPADHSLLVRLISIRLGKDALSKTRLNTSTQKSEAVNRTLSRSNPKNVTFKRTFEGRIHSAVHLLNSGIADSTRRKCEAVGAPITTGSRVSAQLQQGAKREKYLRKMMKSNKYKSRRRESRQKRYQKYFQKKEEIHYRQGLLLENQGWNEHSYAVRTVTSDGEYPSTSGYQASTSRIQTRSRGRKIGKWTRKT